MHCRHVKKNPKRRTQQYLSSGSFQYIGNDQDPKRQDTSLYTKPVTGLDTRFSKPDYPHGTFATINFRKKIYLLGNTSSAWHFHNDDHKKKNVEPAWQLVLWATDRLEHCKPP